MLPLERRICSKEQLREWLDYELKKYPANLIKTIFSLTEAGVLRKHQFLLRKTEYHVNCKHRIRAKVYHLLLHRIQNKYALHIPINVCEKGFKIMHLGPVLINGKAIVGADCSMHMNTALVAGGTSDAAPVLGKGVVVGIGAVVVGGVSVADYTAIGANAVVNRSVVEENTAVAGVPAKKISNNGRLSWNKAFHTDADNAAK